MNKTLKQLLTATMAAGLLAVAGCTNDGDKMDGTAISETTSEVKSEAAETVSAVSTAGSEEVSEEEAKDKTEDKAEAKVAADDYGTAGALAADNYTLAEMLTYAMQDEYLAQAQYEAIALEHDGANPFANISEAEINHINEMWPLFDQNKVDIPVNDAADRVTVPATLDEAYELAVAGEKDSISMYERFLEAEDLPDNVRATFERLLASSEKHLAAFEKKDTGYGNNPN